MTKFTISDRVMSLVVDSEKGEFILVGEVRDIEYKNSAIDDDKYLIATDKGDLHTIIESELRIYNLKIAKEIQEILTEAYELYEDYQNKVGYAQQTFEELEE